MSKQIRLSDRMYESLFKISKSIDISLIDNNMRILNNQDESIIPSKNSVLDILIFVCELSGRLVNIDYIDETPPKIKKKPAEKKPNPVEKVSPKNLPVKKIAREKPSISLNLDNFIDKAPKVEKKKKNKS